MGDCFEFLKNNTLSRAGLNGENGAARNVHYGDILIKFGDCLDGERSDLPFITDDTVLPKFAGSILREGDVIFADTAEDEAAGKCVELRKLPKEPTISGLHTIPARPRFPFGTGYLGHYLNSDAYHRQLLPLMQGIKVISVSKAALQDTQVRFPGLSEQTAIGAALSEIDTLITLHQRKCQYRGLYGYLSWEQRKLGELIQLGGSGGTPSANNPDYYGGDIPFLSIADINGRDITNTAKTLTDEGLQNSAAWIVPSGAVSLAMYASVGKVGIIRQDTATSQAFYNMVFDNEALRDFVFTRLEKAETDSEWEPYISTGTQRNLNADKVKSFSLDVPSNEEASEISAYFANLDTLITLHQ